MSAQWFPTDLRVDIGSDSDAFIFFSQVYFETEIAFLELNGTIVKGEMPIDFHVVVAG